MKNLKKVEYISLIAILVVGYGLLGAYGFTRVNAWRIQKSSEYLYEAKKTSNLTDSLLLYEQAAVLNPNEETYLGAGVTAVKLGDNTLAERYLSRVKTSEGYFQLAGAYYNLEKYSQAASNYQKSLNTRENAVTYLELGKSYLKLGDILNAQNALKRSVELKASDEASTLLALINLDTTEFDEANRVVLSYNELNSLGYPQSAKTLLFEASQKGYLNRDSYIELANEEISAGDYPKAYDYLQRAKTIDPYYPQIYNQLVLVCGKLNKASEASEYQKYHDQITF